MERQGVIRMEEKSGATGKMHKLVLSDRRGGVVSGVVDVLSFDVSEILLETELGMLLVKGQDLHVNRLSLEKGEVEMEGRIDSCAYSEVKSASKTAESLLSRLFR
jgi:sporulation protein YabP